MEKIASFTIDHIKLQPGVYVSRKDHVGAEVITTFDLRMTSPNDEPVMTRQKCTRSSIWVLPSCGITRTSPIRPSTLDQWDAAPASIFSLPGITSRRTSFR